MTTPSTHTTGNQPIEGIDPGGTRPTKPGNPDKGGPAKPRRRQRRADDRQRRPEQPRRRARPVSGTAKEAERAQALRHRAAQGDQEAAAELRRGENAPGPEKAEPHDPGTPPAKP